MSRSHPYRRLENPFEPQRVFSADQVAAVHAGALSILDSQGMKVLSPRARRLYAAGGADVDDASNMVRLDRALVAVCLASAPRSFMLHSVEAAHHVPLNGRSVAFAPSSGAPNVMDIERGRRAGTLADFCDGMKMCQSLDVIQVLGSMCEPQDIPPPLRHLEVIRAQLLLSDKIPFTFSRGMGQVADCFEALRIAHGITAEQFRDRPCTYSIINTNSPLQLDLPMADGIIDFATAGQVLMITPFTLAGAMAPVTIAGALTLAHAEALAGLVLAQLVRPGSPIVYGSFTSNVDMKSGSPAFGTPEYVKAQFGAGQMARHLGLPWRSSNATASNVPDAQAAYESQMSLWGALMGGCNFMLHAAGWLESGLSTSYEKFILDVEMLQMFAELFQAGDAPYTPLVSDGRGFAAWSADGAKTATVRAHGIWKDLLRDYVAPVRDPAIREELNAFVARRIAEGGAPPVS